MEITLSRVQEAARQRRAALTAEAGGYIVLRVLQQLSACPRQVTADHVGLTAAGEVELAPSPLAAASEVERQLRSLLASLLALSQSAPPALRATSERTSVGDLAALEAELAAALIPINPAAQGRALARLFRETHKAAGSGSLTPSERQSPSLPSGRQSSFEATPLSSPARVVSAVPTPTPPSARLALPAPVASAPSVAALELSEWAEFAIDVEIELSESVALDHESASEIEDLDDREVLLVEDEVEVQDELDELLSAPAPVAAPLVVAPAHNATVPPARTERLAAVPSGVSALSARPPSPLAGLDRLTPLPPSGDGPELFESPPPESAPFSGYGSGSGEPEPPPQRSDLRELLAGYLAHTRCEEHMTADLRRMIGLDPWRAPGAVVNRPELGR